MLKKIGIFQKNILQSEVTLIQGGAFIWVSRVHKKIKNNSRKFWKFLRNGDCKKFKSYGKSLYKNRENLRNETSQYFTPFLIRGN